MKNNRAFTLIEILVVIAVIGLLAGITLISVNSAREKSRDAKRAADAKQIQTALELFYDEYGFYPGESSCNPDASNASSGPGSQPCPQDQDWWGAGGLSNDWLGHNISEFIDLPVDPMNDTTYYYHYEPHCTRNGTKQGYWIRYRSESDGQVYLLRGGIQETDPDCIALGCTDYGGYCY